MMLCGAGLEEGLQHADGQLGGIFGRGGEGKPWLKWGLSFPSFDPAGVHG